MPEMIFLDPKDHEQFIKVWDAVQGELGKREDITMLDVVAATMRQAKAYEMRRVCEAGELIRAFCEKAGIDLCKGCSLEGPPPKHCPYPKSCETKEIVKNLRDFKQALAAVEASPKAGDPA